MTSRALGPACLLLLASASPAATADRLLTGASLRLSQRPTQALRVRSDDPAIAVADPGGAADPLRAGGSIRIVAGAGFDRTWPLPAERWRRSPAGGLRLRPTGPFRAIAVRAGRVRIGARGLAVPIEETPEPVHVVLVLGAERFCLTFGGSASHRPGVRFVASDAPAATACGPLEVDAGPDRTVAACEDVLLAGAVRGDVVRSAWRAEGWPLLGLDARGGEARFRAPAVAAPTRLVLTLEAEGDGGARVSDAAEVMVQPAPPVPGLAPGMAPDCGPFTHGVASGDPRADGVVLWTRIDPVDGPSATVEWEVSGDPAFMGLVARGRTTTGAAQDWTVHVEVEGLVPARTWYYRFRAADGRRSAPGRTRTAPAGGADRLRFAVASCSSIYSGFFNAYRRIAERADLDLVIHLGDYLYDFVDEDEQVRLPMPFPSEPADLATWRARHAYYTLDPDLRLARGLHPWAVIWDNHDVQASAAPGYAGSVQAFREWVPIRATPPERPERIYRRLAYGELVDVLMMDTLLFRARDLVPGTGGPSILGNEQFDWLAGELRASVAAWRILGSQKLVATARVNPDFVQAYDGERREFFDPRTWDGFPEDRRRLFDLLAGAGIDDNVAVSGDSHITAVLDLVDDPARADAPVGVELLPTSISRGNFDEQLGIVPPNPIFDLVVGDTLARNPHGVFLELTRHGYGILDVTAERVVGEVWYSPILVRTDAEELGARFTVQRDANRWTR